MMRAAVLLSFLCLSSVPVLAEQSSENATVTVGPWTISTTFKADKFDSCSMSRTAADDLGIAFVRNQDGLVLGLNSSKWKLERGKAYTVRLTAGSHSVDAKALAESKAVTVALVDQTLNERLRTVNVLHVEGEGATLQVPLDGSAAALSRLEICFDKNRQTGIEANPFVAPSHRP
jgi:invasion protein IalB